MAKPGVRGVNAVWRQDQAVGVEVSRRETELAALALALNDGALNGECTPEHLPGIVEAAVPHGVADARAADRLAVERHGP